MTAAHHGRIGQAISGAVRPHGVEMRPRGVHASQHQCSTDMTLVPVSNTKQLFANRSGIGLRYVLKKALGKSSLGSDNARLRSSVKTM